MKRSLNVYNFLEVISSFSHSIVFCYFFALFISYLFLLFFGTLHSVRLIFSFLPCLSLLCFPQLFIKPLQTITLPSWISFSLGWFWSLPPVQGYKLLSILLQSFCLPDLIPWIYLSPPLYNHNGFDLGHNWMTEWFSLLSPTSAWILQWGAHDLSHSQLHVLFLLTV